MSITQAAEIWAAYGTHPVTAKISQAIVNKPLSVDATRLIEATLRDLTPLGNVLSGKGWVNHPPTANEPEPVIKNIDMMRRLDLVTKARRIHFNIILAKAHQSDASEGQLSVRVVSTFGLRVLTTMTLTSELASSTMGIVCTTDQFAGDEMLSSAPTIDVQPGTRVELMDEPIGVTLSSLTGEVVGPSRWEGFVVVRLDKPGVYHNADGTDEPIDEIVEAPDNLTVLSGKK